MTDILSLLKSLNRPRLLVAAANHGLSDYDREKLLGRLLKNRVTPGHGETALRLLAMEQELDEQRIAKDATYSALRHIELLVAIMGEARLLMKRSAQRHENASATSAFLRAI